MQFFKKQVLMASLTMCCYTFPLSVCLRGSKVGIYRLRNTSIRSVELLEGSCYAGSFRKILCLSRCNEGRLEGVTMP